MNSNHYSFNKCYGFLKEGLRLYSIFSKVCATPSGSLFLAGGCHQLHLTSFVIVYLSYFPSSGGGLPWEKVEDWCTAVPRNDSISHVDSSHHHFTRFTDPWHCGCNWENPRSRPIHYMANEDGDYFLPSVTCGSSSVKAQELIIHWASLKCDICC